MNQNIKDIISGFFSGWCQVLIMQPFEIVKIRLQTQSTQNPHYKGMVDAFTKIKIQQGLTAFYKGTVTPLIGIGFYASAMFFTYEYGKRFFSRFKKDPKQRLSLLYIGLSGYLASIPASLVAAPVEHTRIRIQIQRSAIVKQYKGSIDAAISIMKRYGLPGLFRGYLPTFGRESFGLFAYFITYEAIVRQFVQKHQKTSQASIWTSLLGGACAGISFFLVGYPFDYMKTLMQTDNLENNKYKNLRDVFKQRLKQGGIKTFYKGLGVTLIRAVFVNAGAFFSFEVAMRVLGRSPESQ